MRWDPLLFGKQDSALGNSGLPSSDRSVFERDYDRIVFSNAFRKLQDKTQVFSLPKESFVHNRLTHSLEVSSVGRSLGRQSARMIQEKGHTSGISIKLANQFGSIVSAAALAHDIGNPPFGHTGEAVISNYFRHHPDAESFKSQMDTDEWIDLCHFEGNAQGFRLLVRSGDLSISAPVLGAFSKYPSPSHLIKSTPSFIGCKKFGYYQSEKKDFDKMVTECQLIKIKDGQQSCRHPLTFLVEAADDICYNIIDLEDAHRLDILSIDEIIDLLKPIIGDRFDKSKLDKIELPFQKVGILRALSISTLIEHVSITFADNLPDIMKGQFNKALLESSPLADQMKRIQDVSFQKIYRNKQVQHREFVGYRAIVSILEAFVGAILTPKHKGDLKKRYLMDLMGTHVSPQIFNNQQPLYQQFRVVLDFVCGLTDSHCIQLYELLR